MRYGSYNAGAADLEYDVFEDCSHLFCREFERDSEARSLASKAEHFLIFTLVHFDDDSIHPVVLLSPSVPALLRSSGRLPLLPVRDDLLRAFRELVVMVHFESKLLEIFEFAFLVFRFLLGCRGKLVNKGVELAGCRHGGVELTDRASSDIARVCEDRFAFHRTLL